MDSILTSIKKLLGIEETYEHFDQDIVMHINTAIMGLTQLGVGPATGFTISNKDKTWKDFIGDSILLEGVKTYIYLKVRLIFDPPATSFVVDAINRQIQELEWRLNIQAEGGIPSGTV